MQGRDIDELRVFRGENGRQGLVSKLRTKVRGLTDEKLREAFEGLALVSPAGVPAGSG